MNLFKGFQQFKEKIVTAGEDFSSSIISKQRKKQDTSKNKFLAESVGAAELLKCYQENWAAIHTENFHISKAATNMDVSLARIYASTMNQYDSYQRFHSEVAEVVRLSADLERAVSLTNELSASCNTVEQALSELEDLVENRELRAREHARNHELLVQRRQTLAALDQRRVVLAQSHATRVAQVEADKQRELLERQATFEEEFRRDVEFYREHGHPEHPATPALSSTPVADVLTTSVERRRSSSLTEQQEDVLASVQLDDGEAKAALDSFLEAEDTPSNSPVPAIIEQEK